MRLRFFLFVLLFCQLFAVHGQNFPYTLDWQKEATLLSIGAGLSISGHLLETEINPLTQAQATLQNRATINFIDRGATYQRSDAFRTLSDDLLRGALLLPAVTAVSGRVRSRPLIIATLLAETLLLNDGMTKMTKVTFKRNRPFTYNPDFEVSAKTTNNARQSFISGHTSNTAALSFFTAKVFHDLYPDSKLRPYLWGAAAAVPALTGYSRYRAGKHFPTDIIMGYAVGATLGILVPQWHKGEGLRVVPTAEGVGLSLTF